MSNSNGISSLVAIIIINIITSQITFINENSNFFTQEQVNAQNTARAALENIPEIIIENILAEDSKDNKIEVLVTSNNKPNSLISGIDSANEGFLINLTEPNAKKVKKSKASLSKKHKALDNSENSNNKKTKNKETSSNKEDSNYNKGSQTSIKMPIITRRHAVPSTSYYAKH